MDKPSTLAAVDVKALDGRRAAAIAAAASVDELDERACATSAARAS